MNVPGSNMLNVVTVRCGHCANLLSVNMGGLLQSVYIQDFQVLTPNSHHIIMILFVSMQIIKRIIPVLKLEFRFC